MFTDINRDVKAGHQMSSLWGKELSLQVGTIINGAGVSFIIKSTSFMISFIFCL